MAPEQPPLLSAMKRRTNGPSPPRPDTVSPSKGVAARARASLVKEGGRPPHVRPVSSIQSHLTKRGASSGVGGGTMSKDYSINLSVQRVLSLWVQGTVPTLQHFTEMWYWVFLWCLFSSLFVHGAVGLLMCVMLQRHKRGRLITLVLISAGFLASIIGGVLTSAVVAWVYRVAGKDMAPLEALVFGVGQTTLTILISFSRILATL
ncbi:hypothetical protein PGIGA_G00144490 [Pangasianodon gigas]|uniref:Uncharacterized protein n=1 Tax=Pangasianodon gigas TaxID=30993 RepID=A0ACC5XLY5_PANGG|nr:hypothetical protein [Pangasianodon gigas]